MRAQTLLTGRPPIIARRHLVASGHYLASLAGLRMLERGGNAIDAGVATGLAINVVQGDMTNLGGVAPIILYLASSGEVVTIPQDPPVARDVGSAAHAWRDLSAKRPRTGSG